MLETSATKKHKRAKEEIKWYNHFLSAPPYPQPCSIDPLIESYTSHESRLLDQSNLILAGTRERTRH